MPGHQTATPLTTAGSIWFSHRCESRKRPVIPAVERAIVMLKCQGSQCRQEFSYESGQNVTWTVERHGPMRHKSIQTTLKNYAGRKAETVAKELQAAIAHANQTQT